MRKGAPNVFVTGVLPTALYSVEHFELSIKDFDTLQRQSVCCGSVRPIGVLAQFRLLAHDTKKDPGLKARAIPIARWAREVWVMTGNKIHHHDDNLNGEETHKASKLIAMDEWQELLPKGQLRAVRAALQLLDWQLQQAYILVDDVGNELFLAIESPAML
jgi:hypothetical protein